jgi:dihydrofolate reductase
MVKIRIIAAIDKNFAIGKNDQLPWRLSNDLKRFKLLTTGHKVILGRKTFQSIGKPLPNRTSIVLSRNKESIQLPGVFVVSSPREALELCNDESEIFILGGSQIYKEFLPLAHQLDLTLVDTQVDEADAFFPSFDESEWQKIEEIQCVSDEKNEFNHAFQTWVRPKVAPIK